MTEAPGELWLPHERTYTPAPPTADEQAFTDIHGPQPRDCPTTVTVNALEEYL